MLNGFSLAGISEFVREIGDDPREARVTFGAHATPSGPGNALVDFATLGAGTIRVPRRFRLPLSLDGSAGLLPMECALIGLGSCALIVYVQAFTLRGVPVTGLEVDVAVRPDETGEPSVGYTVSVDADTSFDVVRWAADRVSRYSPNHRTICEANDVAFLDGGRGAGPASDVEERCRIRLRWRFGTQIDVFREPEVLVTPEYEVDQPKQLLGIDRAPNPQEWLLAGLAGELAMGDGAADTGVADAMTVTGHTDLRGMLAVDPAVPVRMQDLTVARHGRRGAVAERGGPGSVGTLVGLAQTISVQLRMGGCKDYGWSAPAANVDEFQDRLLAVGGGRSQSQGVE